MLRSLVLMVAAIVSAGAFAVMPGAERAGAAVETFAGGGYPHDDALCQSNEKRVGACPGYNWGYKTRTGWDLSSDRGYDYRNCTDWVAFKLERLGIPKKYWGKLSHARNWAAGAPERGLTVDTTPAAGAVAVRTTGEFGHIAFIESVSGNKVTITDYNNAGTGEWRRTTGTLAALKFHKVIHFERVSIARYAGHIVQWDGDRKPQKTSWLVGPDLRRRWIPNVATYNCLKANGVPGPSVLPSQILNQLPDLSGTQATCTPKTSTAPVVTAIEGASGKVYSDYVPLTIRFRDAECDVVGGTWEGATGSGLRQDFRRAATCSQGIGSIVYARTCHWTGRWTEYITLVDARGNRSSRFSFTYICT